MSRAPAIALALAAALAASGSQRVAAADRAQAVRAVRADLDAAAAALDAGRNDEAATRYRDALDGARALETADFLVALAADGLADTYRVTGRHAEAEPLYREAAELLGRALGPEQPRLAITLHNLGVTLWRDGRPGAAEPELRRALAIWEVTRGKDSVEARNTMLALEAVEAEAGR